ncbi:phosphatase PAP2 family protein [Pelobium sp.]|nr:phosphatase PAP2 family protein [Pelobium sp.]MDA9555231.1 phosphatase PAP2 family protein [Pelobium sp.]
MSKKIITFLIVFSYCFSCLAQTDSSKNTIKNLNIKEEFSKPKKFGFITNVPSDLWGIAKSPFQKENLVGLSTVIGSTALLLWQDQHIVNKAQQFGRYINLDPSTVYSVPVKFGSNRIIKVPSNLNTAFYELGEGGTTMYIAAGLFVFGKINHDNHSLQAASDLTETFITMGLASQVFKRIAGRQTPSSATYRGGRWSPFPSFSNFQNNIASYDSFPSGHLSTMMATVTVLAKDFPEKKWIKPVGYSLMACTGYAMLNNGVHWAGDYPLAIALGYLSGELTVNRHQKHKNHPIN